MSSNYLNATMSRVSYPRRPSSVHCSTTNSSAPPSAAPGHLSTSPPGSIRGDALNLHAGCVTAYARDAM